MGDSLTEGSFRQALKQECQRVEGRYKVYQVAGVFSVIIAAIVLVTVWIWTFEVEKWVKYVATGILGVLIIYLGYLIYKSALVSMALTSAD